MYAVMLAAGNTEFVSAVDRSFPRFRTSRLDHVVTSLARAQGNRDVRNLSDLLDALNRWRQDEPQEFANRGGMNGVAYRLWMEAKQMLRNSSGMQTSFQDPAMPPNCPGSLVRNVYVPPGEGHAEICHGFAYRWAVAAGTMPENHGLPAAGSTFNPQNSGPVLYPQGFANYQPARANGVMNVQPGDIIGMFAVPQGGQGAPVLGHSLIAESPTVWFSANNAGTFGVGTGRTQIDTAGNFGIYAGHQVGWVGNGNVWMRPDGMQLTVIYRR